jgi:uncharacterized protein
MPKKRFLLLIFFSLLLITSLGATFYFIFLWSDGGAPISGNPTAGPVKDRQQALPPATAMPGTLSLHDTPPENNAAAVQLIPEKQTENQTEDQADENPISPGIHTESLPAVRPDEQAKGILPDNPHQVTPGTENEPGKIAPESAESSTGTAANPELPLVAIVIDDMGYERLAGEQLLALDLDLTFSFLPHAPHTRTLSRLARGIGRDVLLHLPMEPIDTPRRDPGPGALFLAMPVAELQRHLQENLAMVPMAIGVNNHMGSRFTANPQAMATVMAILQPRGLFFLDSMTTADSTGYQVAGEYGLPAIRRDIFLDNDRTVEAIELQLAALIRLARKKGAAVAIAHPHAGTVAALNGYQEQLRTEVRVVGIQSIIR